MTTGGCAKNSTLTVKPSTPQAAELLPADLLEAGVYKKLLLLPIESKLDVKDTDVAVLAEKQTSYYSAKIEKALLAQGFELISPEIVARAEKGIKGGKLSAAEKALILGKETKADAVFLVQELAIRGTVDYFTVEDLKTQPVDASRVKTDKKDRLYHSETEQCVFKLPYYEVRFEGKLIDARSGNVLWVGSGRQNVVDALEESWVAKLDKDCGLEKENFVFTDYVASESTLDSTFGGLVSRLLEPMKKSAMAGAPLLADEKPAPPKAEPKPEPPKVKTATVSGKKASLRAGPGKRNQRIRMIPRKSKVEVLETMGEWIKVKTQDGSTGWMHDSVIIVNDG
ncbi:MAG: SH3 domain-containing protein [Nannocystaceae bacterium]|nr:SH3 domain-containing protein [Nannocystaceae bacterium]